MKRKILALLALAALLSGNALATEGDIAISTPEATAIAAQETQAPADKQEGTPAAEISDGAVTDVEATMEAGAEPTQAPAESPAVDPAAQDTPEPDASGNDGQDLPPEKGFLQKYWIALVAGAAALGAGVTALALHFARKDKKPAAQKKAPANKKPNEADKIPEISRVIPKEMDYTVPLRPEKMRIKAVGNVHNIGRRKSQQDAFGVSALSNKVLVDRKGVLAIVADGMGGLENSGEISRAMVRGALEDFPRMPDDQRKGLLSLLASANRKVDEQFAGLGRIGTTFIAVNIKDDRMDFISVGDSRISLLRGGSLITLNRAHNYAAELQAAAAVGDGSITGADQNPRGAALTSYLGMRSLQKVDFPTESIRLMKGDMVILMTDGIFGTLDETTIAEALKNGAAEGAARIEEAILARKKPNQDNFTAIILEV